MSGGDDSAAQGEVRTRRSCQDIEEIRQVGDRTREWSASAIAGSAACAFSGAIQMKPRPERRAPSQSRRSESPTNSVVSGAAPSASKRGAEDRRIGLFGADALAVGHRAEQRREARASADRFEIAVEVRHDAQGGSARRAPRAPAGCERTRPTRRRESAGATRSRGRRQLTGATPARRQARASRLAASASTVSVEAGSERKPPTSAIVGGVEGRRESFGGNVQALSPIKRVKALLPRHAVGVERAAEVEQQRFDLLRLKQRAAASASPLRALLPAGSASPTRPAVRKARRR